MPVSQKPEKNIGNQRSGKHMASMLTIRRLAQRQSVCRVIPQLYSIRRAAFSSIATAQESMVDQGSPDLTQSKKIQTPSNYKPLPKVDKLIPKEPHSRLVSLYNLPSTATKEDILRLARMAFHNVDTTIEEILFLRSQELLFNGRVLILFSSPEDAKQFRLATDRVTVGGNYLKVARLETKNIDSKDLLVRYRKPEMYSTNGKSAAGRTVVLSGFPQRTNTFHVSKWLQSKGYYPEDDEKDSIIQLDTKHQAFVSKFFVRFPSESDAWRAVRRFHNVTFRPNTFNNRYTIRATVAY